MRKLMELSEEIKEVKTEKEKIKTEKPSSASSNKEKWIPYDGNLEEATYTDKFRHFKDPDGTLRTIKEVVVSKEGKSQYSVVGDELLEWRKGRGGTKRRLVMTFKKSFQDTPEGRKRKEQQAAFRAMLRNKGIPGA